MRSPNRVSVSKTVSILAIIAALSCGSISHAQTTEETEDERKSAVDVLTQQTVVVTGTKKADGENVQDTAISIVAFGEDQLDAFNIQDISDLSFKIPNVALDEIGTVKGVANFTVRGLGVNSSIPTIDPAVGTFVDGVYLGVNFGVVFDTFDLAGFETFRGPQGVLFGRNVTGGAVLLNSSDPSDELVVKAKVNVESGLRGTGTNYITQGLISGPILKDVVSAKLGVYYNEDNGFFENSVPIVPIDFGDTNVLVSESQTFGASETLILRGGLKFTPTDDISLVLKYEHGDTDGQGPAAQSRTNGSGIDGQIFNAESDSLDFSIDELGFDVSNWDQFTARLDWDIPFGSGTITNIFGYREFDQESRLDVDASPLFLFHANFATQQDQISNELRYNGRFFEDRLDFTTGIFYFEQDIIYEEDRDLLRGALIQNGGGIQDQRTIGIFANAEYDVTEAFSVNAGIRWNDEEKDGLIANIALNTGNPCVIILDEARVLPDGTTSLTPCLFDTEQEVNESNFSPKIGAGYEFNDQLRFYTHWSRAFRAGGFNFRNTNGAATQDPFEEERIDNFEIGFKSEPYRGASLNGAIFFNLLDDLQRETNVSDPTAGVVQTILNAGDADIFGIELDATIPVTKNLVLTAGIGYLDGDFTDILVDLSGDGVIDETDFDLDIPRLAPFSANVGFVYSQAIPSIGGYATLNFNYAHRDSSAFTDNNLGVLNTADRIDANLTLDLFEDHLSVSVYGRNLTNDVQIGGDTQLPAALGGVPLGGTFSPLARGRTFGIELEYNF